MDNRLKRFLSLALAMVMVIGMMPANIVFATETEGAPDAEENQPLLVEDFEDNTQENEPMLMALTGCTLIEGCALDEGHTGDCEDTNGQLLVNPSSVLTAAGLKAAIGTGGTIVLAADIELQEAITVVSATTLNLNGHDITVAAPIVGQPAPDYALINKSTLTVKGSGSVAGLMNEGNVTVQGGSFVASRSATYALRNKGTAIINGGAFYAAGGEYAVYNDSAKRMTFKDATVFGLYNASGIVTVNSGEFNGNTGAHAIYSMGGSLTVTGGEFHNNTAEVATVLLKNTCSAIISGGTITNEAKAPALAVETIGNFGATISGNAVIKSGIAVADGGKLTVNGGTFHDADDNSFSATGTVNITVNGGTYEEENAQNFARAYAADGKILIFKEGNVEVKKVRSAPGEVSNVIATIGTGDAIVGYPSLDAAVQVGGTVDLIADTILEETVEVSKTVILNLNDHRVDAYDVDTAIYVKAGSSLTVNGSDGVINANCAIANHGALVVNSGEISSLHSGDIAADTATATLNGGEFYEIVNEGRMTFSGATVNGWLENYGVFEMTDGVIEDMLVYGLVVNPACGISTTIKGGMVEYLYSCDYAGATIGNVVTIDAGAQNSIPEVGFIYAAKEEGAETKSKIEIKNGNIVNVYAYQFNDEGEIPGASVEGMISISGGTFIYRPEDVHVKDGYEVIENQITGGVVYIVRLKKVDLLDPTGTTLNNLLTNNGAGSHITRDWVLDDIRNNENLKVVTNESGYTLFISPKSVVIEAGTPYKTSRITYSVTPKDLMGNPISNPGKAITFNLPIPGALPEHVDYANVYHGNEKMTGPEAGGIFAIKGEGEQRYVTVTSETFSDFTVETIDVDYSDHVAKIGVKGYASVQAAIDAVQDGQTIELLQLPEQKVYGPAVIDLSEGKSFTIDGAATVNNAEVNRAWYYDDDATITITGSSHAGKTVTIKNIEFNRVNKADGEFIKITGNGRKRNGVEIVNCTFVGAGSNSDMVAVNLNNTNGVVIDGGVATGLKAFLINSKGKNLTVKNVTIRDCNVGMELGAVQGVSVEGVTITSTVGKYGISMDASKNNNAVFTSCNITAAVPVMVYGAPRTTHGKIAFNGTSTMTGSSRYWIILSDEKYSEKPEGTDPESLSATGRIVITVTDAGLLAAGINDKHMDESDASARKYYTVAPKAKLESAVAFDEAADKDSHISIDIQDLVASERVVIEIYDEAGTKIAETKLVNNDVLYTTPLTGVVEIARQSGSWDTTWLTAEKCPTYRNVPAKAKLLVDGKVMGEVPVEMYVKEIPESARVWTDIEGVGNLTLTVGEQITWKHTLAEALDAAPKTGGTVTLYKDNAIVLSAAGEVTGGKTVTVTGEATFNWGQDWLFVGRGENPGDGTLIFDKAKIKAYAGEGNTGDMGFHVSGAKVSAPNTCNGTLQIVNGSNVEVDFFVNRNYVELDNSVLTVKHGFYLHGRPADETPDGKDATAGMDVTNGAVLNIQSAVNAILGEEGNGELNVCDATFNCAADVFEIVDEPDTQLNVSGTSTLNIKKLEGKAVNLLDGVVIKDSTVGGAAVAVGTKEKNVNVTFSGKNTFGDVTVTNGIVNVNGNCKVHNIAVIGTLNTNTESTITANKIIMESDDDKLVIDATNLTNEAGAKVIDLSGDAESKSLMNSTRVFVKDDLAVKRVADDGDVYVYYVAFIDKNGNGKLDTSDKGYKTLPEAVAAAKKDEKVFLLTDTTVSELEISEKITLDLKGNTVSANNPLEITAAGVTIQNGKVDGAEIAIGVDEKAELTLNAVTVEADSIGILSFGKVTVAKDAHVKGVVADTDPDTYHCGIVLCKDGEANVAGGKVSGEIAVLVLGGKLNVTDGTVEGSADAIQTNGFGGELSDEATVAISGKDTKVIGAIYVSGGQDELPKATVTITGGTFTDNEMFVAGKNNKIVVSGGNFDKFVPLELCAVDYTCRKIKDSNPVMYEVVYYEHVRIFLKNADSDNKVVVGKNAYADGNPYEVQPGKVLLVTKELAKQKAMFVTTYGYDEKNPSVKEDDFPNAMYVWYVVGKNPVNGVYTAYDVERVAELDNFFQYNGTSIRVGAAKNGIRFFSSVDEKDATKLMNGTLIERTGSALVGAKMTQTGTEFWKTEDNKLRSEVYGGAVGKSFRVFQQKDGRNWFTGVLVGLDTNAETVVASIYSRPYAEVKVGDQTAILYGGILDRSIYYVATQNKDVFANGSSYDKFVEGLIAMGDEFLNAGTGS